MVAGTFGLGYLMSQASHFVPAIFPQPASYPYWDAGTTVASFVAMALLAVRRLESWFWWIGVDVVGIGLYWMKDVRFLAMLYGLLLGLAVQGLLKWRAEWARPQVPRSADPTTGQ